MFTRGYSTQKLRNMVNMGIVGLNGNIIRETKRTTPRKPKMSSFLLIFEAGLICRDMLDDGGRNSTLRWKAPEIIDLMSWRPEIPTKGIKITARLLPISWPGYQANCWTSKDDAECYRQNDPKWCSTILKRTWWYLILSESSWHLVMISDTCTILYRHI